MTVVEGWFAGKKWDRVPPKESMSAHMLELLQMNCAMNSKAFLVDHSDSGGQLEFVGNRTECALLVLLRKLGIDYTAIRGQKESEQVCSY
jgi:P-type Ca2+ transporter type 2C